MTDPTSDKGLLAEAVGDLLSDLCPPEVVAAAEEGVWPDRLWTALSEAGFTRIGLPESAGGSGGDLSDACVMLLAAGRHAVPLPLAETALLGGWALAETGLAIPSGPVTVSVTGSVLQAERDGDGWRIDGRLDRVPWAGRSELVVTLVDTPGDPMLLAVPPGRAELIPGRNLAGEPRDGLVFTGVRVTEGELVPAPGHVTRDALLRRAALGRAALMAGAIERISALTIRYTDERQQFGRPVSRFQAVAQHLVRIAGEAALAGMAVQAASVPDEAVPGPLPAAGAKIVAGQAATTAAALAHQAHGAIGMTMEYELGHFTRRLWAWRDEYGSERYWSEHLGEDLVTRGADQLWPTLTG